MHPGQPGSPSPVQVDTTDGVTTLTLTDEANRNALSRRVIANMIDGITTADADPAVRVVVVTNTGPVFCAGADLSEQSPADDSEGAPGFEVLLGAILASPTPVVGRIDGHAVAGGVGLAAACDISVARNDVLLGFTEVRVGVIPAMISVVCLPKMRRGDALEVFLRGTRFPATRAADLGLINHAVSAGDLDATVAEVIADLKLGGPDALAGAKQLVDEVPRMAAGEAFRVTAEQSAEIFASDEASEGMAAFRARRRPAWAPPEG